MREFIFGNGDPRSLINPYNSDVELSFENDLNFNAVKMHYAVMEIPAADARAIVPTSLHATAPGLVSIHFWNVSESDVGPFTLAMVGVVVRTNYKPRHLIVSSFVNTQEARTALSGRCGFPLRLAEVEQQEYNDAVLSRVFVNGKAVLDISTHEMQLIVGSAAALKISPMLSVARIDSHNVLVQAETSYEFKATRRGRPIIHEFDSSALALGNVKLGMPAMSAVASVDISLHPLRFSLDLAVPAEQMPSRRLRGKVSIA